MENELIKILYIDDEKAALFNFEQLFNDDFEIYTANSAERGMEILGNTDIHIIVSDQRMPHKTGVGFFSEVAQQYPNTIRILLTAYSEAADIIAAINQGQIYQYITKPFETRNVKNILDKASQLWRLKNENQELIVQLQNRNTEFQAINQELYKTNEELQSAYKKTEESIVKIQEILQTVMDGFWIVDLNGKLIDVNEVACKMLGYTREELLELSLGDMELIENSKQTRLRIQNIIEIGEDRFESKHRCKNGEPIDVELSVKLQSTQNLMVVFVRDITERKKAELNILTTQEELKKSLEVSNQSRVMLLNVLEDQQNAQLKINQLNEELEQRVKTRTAQLEAANKELETFTYSVSHDLKAPLRGIDGYSKLLLELHGKNLDEEAKTFLSTIRSSTLQMNQLIEDLLEYSRLERSQVSREKIKIKDLISSLISIYKNELNSGNYSLQIDVLDIELTADSKGLSIALRNILENAIKFTKGKTNPTIAIGLEEKASSWIILIRDNGIGFDMKYHQRIFEIFQRLQRAEDFQGTGVGLAMVSKAMQRMDGKTWAESAIGMGSTFYLEIPK